MVENLFGFFKDQWFIFAIIIGVLVIGGTIKKMAAKGGKKA